MRIVWLVILLVLCLAVNALAASCPHCGQTYGEGSSSDSSYIASIRAAHEASCSARSSTSGGGYGGGYGNTGYSPPVYDRRADQLRLEAERQRQLDKERRQREAEAAQALLRQQAEAARQQFLHDKEAALSDLKGATAGSSPLKTGTSTLGLKGASAESLGLKSVAPVVQDGAVSLKHMTEPAPVVSPSVGKRYSLRAPGHPIVPADQLGALETADTKALLAGLSDEELQELAQHVEQRTDKLTTTIDRVRDLETKARLGGFSPADQQGLSDLMIAKLMDDVPLARTMEALGNEAGGGSAAKGAKLRDLVHKSGMDSVTAFDKATQGTIDVRGAAAAEILMAYQKFTEAGNVTDGYLAAAPHAANVVKTFMPKPEDLKDYGKGTTKVAKRGATVLAVATESIDVGHRGMDMYLFNEGSRSDQAAKKALSFELASMRNDLTRKRRQNAHLNQLVQQEHRRR